MPLACAQVFDPDNIGLEYWYAGSPANDARQEQANQRMQCYDLVMDSLSVFEEKCGAKKPAQVLPGLDDPETVRSHAYELAFACEDEMFHSVLYDWLIGRGLADDLLEVYSFFHCFTSSSLSGYVRCDLPTLKHTSGANL